MPDCVAVQVAEGKHWPCDYSNCNCNTHHLSRWLQVTHKHTGPYSRSLDCSDDLEALVPAWHPASSPSKSALRQRPSWQRGQQDDDASLSQHCSLAGNAGLSPQRLRQRRDSQCQQYASVDMLCRDMQQLDAQIANLDVNLASASHRLHH